MLDGPITGQGHAVCAACCAYLCVLCVPSQRSHRQRPPSVVNGQGERGILFLTGKPGGRIEKKKPVKPVYSVLCDDPMRGTRGGRRVRADKKGKDEKTKVEKTNRQCNRATEHLTVHIDKLARQALQAPGTRTRKMEYHETKTKLPLRQAPFCTLLHVGYQLLAGQRGIKRRDDTGRSSPTGASTGLVRSARVVIVEVGRRMLCFLFDYIWKRRC